METQKGEKFTRDDLKGSFSLIMFGQSVSDHAMQGLAKMQEIVVEQGTSLLDGVVGKHLFCPILFVWAHISFICDGAIG